MKERIYNTNDRISFRTSYGMAKGIVRRIYINEDGTRTLLVSITNKLRCGDTQDVYRIAYMYYNETSKESTIVAFDTLSEGEKIMIKRPPRYYLHV